jgi:multidrug efflux pump subunit AcrA (membrane-fusion protein)
MYAEVDLVTDQQKNALAVPVEAVDGSGTSARVFKVASSGKIEIVPVRLGIETAQQAQILSGDLKEGDSVVVGSRSALLAGEKVQPKSVSLDGSAAPKS